MTSFPTIPKCTDRFRVLSKFVTEWLIQQWPDQGLNLLTGQSLLTQVWEMLSLIPLPFLYPKVIHMIHQASKAGTQCGPGAWHNDSTGQVSTYQEQATCICRDELFTLQGMQSSKELPRLPYNLVYTINSPRRSKWGNSLFLFKKYDKQ